LLFLTLIGICFEIFLTDIHGSSDDKTLNLNILMYFKIIK